MIDFASLTAGDDGLVVTVVQDADTRAVLMVGFMNADALDLTTTTGKVHFWSRSRQQLWMKGETSGNILHLESIEADCDRDALLINATPTGPVCHTGRSTCFDADRRVPVRHRLGETVDHLAELIETRRAADPSTSYTARLMGDGDLAARKVLEEAGEVAFAAKDAVSGGDLQRVVEESADLVYHLLAMLAGLGVSPGDVAAELEARKLAGSAP